jgi:hypothetical protein
VIADIYLVNHDNNRKSFLDCMTNCPLSIYLLINIDQ